MMKLSTKLLALLAVSTVALFGFGCQKTPAQLSTTTSAAVKGDVAATSVNITLKSSGCAKYAYQIVEGANTTAPAPEVIFAEAQDGDGLYDVASDEMDVPFYGLSGNTDYTIHFALTSATDVTKYSTASVSFKTADYSQILTLIRADMFSIKFHVEVAADKYYRYTIFNRDLYYDRISQTHNSDADFLLYNGGAFAKGPKDFEWFDGGIVDAGSDGYAIKPGTAYVVFLAECDSEGNLLIDEPEKPTDVASAPTAPNTTGGYTEVYDRGYNPFHGFYAKQYFYTQLPAKGTGDFDIKLTKATERTAWLQITPDPSIIKYGMGVMTLDAWDLFVSWVGEEGMPALCLGNSQAYTSAATYTWPIEPGNKYRLIVVGQEDLAGTVQVCKTFDFEPKISTKPAPEIVITPKSDPNGIFYNVHFNVKAPNRDCYAVKYLCNYTREWVQTSNSDEMSDSELVDTWGIPLTAEQVNAINSDGGCDMTFEAYEHTELTFVICAYNDEEKRAFYKSVNSSLEVPDKERVESTLFTDLLGDWTVNFTANEMEYDENGENGKEVVKNYVYKITVAGGPEQGPASLAAWKASDKEAYDNAYYYYYNQAELKRLSPEECTAYADKQIGLLFDEFKAMASHYADKYRGQNRLVARGCSMIEVLEYQSPWDLFCSTAYSAYDTEELFVDYGPKIFFEISKDDEGNDRLTVETNPAYIAPLVGYTYNTWRWWGSATEGDYANAYYSDSFDVEVSADHQTLTMKPKYLEQYNTTFYPSVLTSSGGSYYMAVYAASQDVVITKGWSEPKSTKSSFVKPAVEIVPGNGTRSLRTRIPAMPSAKATEIHEMELLTPATINK